jgi:hypothetical protein
MAASRPGGGCAAASQDGHDDRPSGVSVQAMSDLGEIAPIFVSEGGLEHPLEWYITETVIYHQPKVTRQGPPGPHDQSEHLTCGNDDRGQPESSCRPGPDGGIRTAALHHLAGRVTASRCCPEVPAPQPRPPRTSPDDLAAELNPHKTELNPHKAVETASRVGPSDAPTGVAGLTIVGNRITAIDVITDPAKLGRGHVN